MTQTDRDYGDRCCVYVTGSLGRSEASQFSDLDLFIVGQQRQQQQRSLPHLEELLLKADLIRVSRGQGFPDFSGDGEYLAHYTDTVLIEKLGKPEDDVGNTFTARLLLLLESQPLLGEPIYWSTVDKVIDAYWRDFKDHPNDFVPAYLANDIQRMWRTFCVNYEAYTASTPARKRAKRKLKNYKLKHSRLLTCYSGLLYLLTRYALKKTVTPADVREMVKLAPSRRLEWCAGEIAGCKPYVKSLRAAYEQFLQHTAQPEDRLIELFQNSNWTRQRNEEARKFGDGIFELLQYLGRKHSGFYRLLVV